MEEGTVFYTVDSQPFGIPSPAEIMNKGGSFYIRCRKTPGLTSPPAITAACGFLSKKRTEKARWALQTISRRGTENPPGGRRFPAAQRQKEW